MKILIFCFLLLVAFAIGASWAELKAEKLIKRLEFKNHLLRLDCQRLSETLQELRRKENGNT
jgi:hypothetical protein